MKKSMRFSTNEVEPTDMSEAGDHLRVTIEEPAMKEGTNLVFKDVSVKIGQKTIISKLSGVAKSGQLLAIMGPSGRSRVIYHWGPINHGAQW